MKQKRKLRSLSFDSNKFDNDKYFAGWLAASDEDDYEMYKDAAACLEKDYGGNPHFTDYLIRLKSFKQSIAVFKKEIDKKDFSLDLAKTLIQLPMEVNDLEERIYGICELTT